MKTNQFKSLSLIFGMLVFVLSTNLFAQQDEEKKPPPGYEDKHLNAPHMVKHQKGHLPPIPDLTDEQKEQIKELEINFMKEALPMKNQIGEREARLRTLSTEEEADINAIYDIIEEIGELNIQMMKKQAAQHQEIRKILNANQRVVFDLGP